MRILGWLLLLLSGASVHPAGPWSWSDASRIVSVGDVHGAYDQLEGLLRATRLIDERGEWIGGSTHLVSTGDLVDRGPDSRKVLDLLMRLEDQASRRGGQVHVLLGNHEAMVLAGDRRYVNPAEYEAFRDDAPPGAPTTAEGQHRGFEGYLAAFSPEGRYGRWLLERNAVIRIDDVLFVHGGLSPMLAETDPAELNRRLTDELRALVESQRALVEAGVLAPGAELGEQIRVIDRLLEPSAQAGTDPAIVAHAQRVRDYDETLAFRPDGPLWYRGTAENPEEQERGIVDAVLGKLEARMAVLGHTPTPDSFVRSRFGGRVVLADTGMLTSYYGGRASAVKITPGKIVAVYPSERLEEPPRPLDAPASSEERPAAKPASPTDAEIERFLATAKVVASKEIGTGITNPKRLTLSDGTREMRAIFKSVEVIAGDSASSTDLLARINQSDRWQYEVAAYRLDRLLGLGLVPVAVERAVDGKPGAVQLWIEDAIDEVERVERGLVPSDREAFDEQFRRMRILDALIHNEDRNQTNVLYTPADWRVHAIDHTRAFRTRTSFPPELRKQDLTPPPELAERLAALDAKTLKAQLGDLLQGIQIQALLKRRDQLLRKKRRRPRARLPARLAALAHRHRGSCARTPLGYSGAGPA